MIYERLLRMVLKKISLRLYRLHASIGNYFSYLKLLFIHSKSITSFEASRTCFGKHKLKKNYNDDKDLAKQKNKINKFGASHLQVYATQND